MTTNISNLIAIGIIALAGIAVVAILTGNMTLANIFLKLFGGA